MFYAQLIDVRSSVSDSILITSSQSHHRNQDRIIILSLYVMMSYHDNISRKLIVIEELDILHKFED